MHILLIGGTRFLGRHLVEAALTRGHEVTLFNRGKTNAALFTGAEKLVGDRKSDLNVLQGRRWDAAIDTCGYVPRVVSASAETLSHSVDHYTFISSISVYADFSQPGMNETAPLAALPDETVEEVTNETYGALKALCERAAEKAMPGRVLNVRPGFIVGPHDPTDRFTYWPYRVAQGGEVAAPGTPGDPVQFIDVRDLADWIVRMVETGKTGAYHATGPDHLLTMQRFLDTCKDTTKSDARFTWISEAFLAQREAEADFPIWVPASEAGGATIDCAKAITDGLTFRPLADTILATLEWNATRPAGFEHRAGLSTEQETALLRAWREQQSQEARS